MHVETQKITAHIPKHLLVDAQAETGKGITETIRVGLEQLALAKTYDALRKKRGKVKFSISVDALREDK